jgi:hypothetical protein
MKNPDCLVGLFICRIQSPRGSFGRLRMTEGMVQYDGEDDADEEIMARHSGFLARHRHSERSEESTDCVSRMDPSTGSGWRYSGRCGSKYWLLHGTFGG